MESLLIALGGNALTMPGEEGNLQQQFQHARETMAELARIFAARPCRVVISHGNGPQVGNVLLRSEHARDILYPLTLDICVSDTEGGMGYMLQQVLHNELIRHGMQRDVVTIITQVEVDPCDPAMQNPSKFIGLWLSEEDAKKRAAEQGWTVKQDSNRGWRRVVASPLPVDIVEKNVIHAILDAGAIVIAGGGGGIPVMKSPGGMLLGVEGVVDKDLASALLAARLGLETLVIVTAVEKVCLDFGKPGARSLDHLNAHDAIRLLREDQFPAGSMGPKISAAVNFLNSGGKRVVITCPGQVRDALDGRAGTAITA